MTYSLAPVPDGITPYTYRLTPSLPPVSRLIPAFECSKARRLNFFPVMTYTVIDRNGGVFSQFFQLTITEPDFADTVQSDQFYSTDTSIMDLELPSANNGVAPLSYSLAPLPTGLSFNATRRVLTGTPSALGATTTTYSAISDGVALTLTQTINIAPGVSESI